MFDFLSKKFSGLFSALTGKSRLTQSNIDDTLIKVHEALLEADVPYQVVIDFIEALKKEIIGKKILESLKPAEQLMHIVHTKMVEFLGGAAGEAGFTFQIPSTVLMMGLQGAGKTTTIGKLATFVKEQAEKRGKKRRILVASVDFYRPAAVEQLAVVAQAIGVDFYRAKEVDPVKAAHEIAAYAQKNQYELLFLDTAGRLHIDEQLLQELTRINALLKPKYSFLVIDAMIGQQSLQVAQAFNARVPYTGAILTKMDSDTRSGVAFAFKYVLKKPILFVATGEKPDDLELFYPERIARRILGMGDVATLLEKAETKIKASEQARLEQAMSSGHMTLEDFEQQLGMINKMGSLSSLTKYLPGLPNVDISPEMMEKGEREIRKFRAIIRSMTPKERVYPKILNGSRKQRIALGAGVQPADVNLLLQRFEESQQFAKMIKKMGRFNQFFQ